MKRNHWSAMSYTVCALGLAGCASATVQAPVEVVPEALNPPPGQTLKLQLQAVGVQIYQCSAAKDDATHFTWTLTAPEASLFDPAGEPIGRHYAGPTWEAADGSSVVGTLKSRDPGPDPASIPWLLLEAKPSSGDGVFGAVQWVQRRDTSGGKAPAEGCDEAHAGAELRVPYKAAYYFYSAAP